MKCHALKCVTAMADTHSIHQRLNFALYETFEVSRITASVTEAVVGAKAFPLHVTINTYDACCSYY